MPRSKEAQTLGKLLALSIGPLVARLPPRDQGPAHFPRGRRTFFRAPEFYGLVLTRRLFTTPEAANEARRCLAERWEADMSSGSTECVRGDRSAFGGFRTRDRAVGPSASVPAERAGHRQLPGRIARGSRGTADLFAPLAAKRCGEGGS